MLADARLCGEAAEKGDLHFGTIRINFAEANVKGSLGGPFSWSKGGFTVWATVKTVAQTVFPVAQSVIAVAHGACSDAPKPPSIA